MESLTASHDSECGRRCKMEDCQSGGDVELREVAVTAQARQAEQCNEARAILGEGAMAGRRKIA